MATADVADGQAGRDEAGGPTWLSVPELAERLGVRQRDVRSALSDRQLVGRRRGEVGAVAVPAEFLVPAPDGDGEVVLPSLRGTLLLLADVGLTDDEALTWLFEHDDALGAAPVEALRSGRTHAVRRAAQIL